MTQSPQQPDHRTALSGEVMLGIARDLEGVTDRIAEMKALCDRQLGELADAAAAAAGITEALIRRQMPVATDTVFLGLTAELAHLHATIEAQAELCKNISLQFLEITRQVDAELRALREAGMTLANPPLSPAARNVVWLAGRHEARNDAVAQAGANDLRLALQAMQDSTVLLFRAQMESGRMIASLRQRMREHRQRTRDA